jgi:toxin CcdB
MAKFDVLRRRSGAGYLLDCQADLLGQLNTRFVVPLLPAESAPRPAARLNPTFELESQPHVMMTQLAAAVLVAELGEKVGSLIDRDVEISNALDILISGV